MKKYKIEDNPRKVGERQKKAIINEFDERVKGNTLYKKCKK